MVVAGQQGDRKEALQACLWLSLPHPVFAQEAVADVGDHDTLRVDRLFLEVVEVFLLRCGAADP